MAAKPKIPKDPFTLTVSCPSCDEPAKIKARPPKSRYNFECEDCDFEAEAFVVVIRAKRSKKSGRGAQGGSMYGLRDFNIRVIDLGSREHHLEYRVVDETELEMRQGDLVVFFEDGSDGILGVCNTTLRTTEEVQTYRPNASGCAVFLALVALLFSAGFGLTVFR